MIKSRIGPAVQKSYIVINKIAATQVDCFLIFRLLQDIFGGVFFSLSWFHSFKKKQKKKTVLVTSARQ